MSPSFANLSPLPKTSHNPLNPHHVSVIDAPITNPMPYASLHPYVTPFGTIYNPELTRLADPALRRPRPWPNRSQYWTRISSERYGHSVLYEAELIGRG